MSGIRRKQTIVCLTIDIRPPKLPVNREAYLIAASQFLNCNNRLRIAHSEI
jgi:hypothetical protein